MSPSDPSASAAATGGRRWSTGLTIAANIFGSLILAVVGTFLSDYIKSWLSSYSAGLRQNQIASLQGELLLQEHLHQAFSQYVLYVGELALKASLLAVLLTITGAIYTVFLTGLSEVFVTAYTKYIGSLRFGISVLYAIITVSISLSIFSYYRSALEATSFQRNYDANRQDVMHRLEVLRQSTK
jgi:hypothetical protein